MQVEKYVEQARDWLEPFFTKKPSLNKTQRCCIRIGAKEISLIQVNNLLNTAQATIEILLLETFAYNNASEIPLILTGIVKNNTLAAIPCYWLLAPEDYQLLLIDALSVKPDEFTNALNWRVRSLISYPIEEAIIDYFKIPAKKSTPDNPMIAAVVVRMQALTKTIELFKRCDLELTTIDIPELSLRNLSALYEDDEKSTAFIYFYLNIAILNLSRNKTLYFTRHINVPMDKKLNTQNYEQLCLDILRYFDYFQTQWRFPTPTRIFVASEKKPVLEIASALSQHFMLTVEPFPLKYVQIDATKMHLLEQKYLLALGCALRGEIDNVPSGN